jgi:hypothetical protein
MASVNAGAVYGYILYVVSEYGYEVCILLPHVAKREDRVRHLSPQQSLYVVVPQQKINKI